MLELEDRWIWDWWYAETSDAIHVFYLQAPRSLRDPDLRHRNASIGHAVSTDLRNWTVLPDALEHGAVGDFDEQATWTGCVVATDRGWSMFYTGLSAAMEQRIGIAESSDLITWRKRPENPVLTGGGPWYEPTGPHVAWRDPWIHPTAEGFRMLITASDATRTGRYRGVVGTATSTDLVSWQAGPPLVSASDFDELEVPQLVDVGGQSVLIFSCGTAGLSERRRTEVNGGGSYYVVLDGHPTSSDRAVALDVPALYACRVIQDSEGAPSVIGFINRDPHLQFRGTLSDPVPLLDAMPGLVTGDPSGSNP